MDVTQKILVKFLCLAKVKRTEMFCQPKLAKELIDRESLSCRAREDPLKPFSLVLESAVGQTRSLSSVSYSHNSLWELLFRVKLSHAGILAYSPKF